MYYSLVAQLIKNLPAMRETWVQFLGWEEPLEKGKAKDLFKKIRDIRGTFHAKMGSIKDRNDGMGLTEAEDIKKRWQEYTEELYKKRSVLPR